MREPLETYESVWSYIHEWDSRLGETVRPISRAEYEYWNYHALPYGWWIQRPRTEKLLGKLQ